MSKDWLTPSERRQAVRELAKETGKDVQSLLTMRIEIAAMVDLAGPESVLVTAGAHVQNLLMGVNPWILPGRDARRGTTIKDRLAASLACARALEPGCPYEAARADVAALVRMGRL